MASPEALERFYGHYLLTNKKSGSVFRGFCSPTLDFIFVPIFANTVSDISAFFLNVQYLTTILSSSTLCKILAGPEVSEFYSNLLEMKK